MVVVFDVVLTRAGVLGVVRWWCMRNTHKHKIERKSERMRKRLDIDAVDCRKNGFATTTPYWYYCSVGGVGGVRL